MSAERSTPKRPDTLGAFRTDVREATAAAAAAEFRFHNLCLVLASAELIDELMQDWSKPVQLMAGRDTNGLVDLTVRDAESFDVVAALRKRSDSEPLFVDISDYSDEFCAGFLAGQSNALDAIYNVRECQGELGVDAMIRDTGLSE